MLSCPLYVVVIVMMAVRSEAALKIDCQRCICAQQNSVYSLHCQLTGKEDVVLDGPGLLDFSRHTLYMRVENASSLSVPAGFLRALRRYHSVAVDLWDIGNLSFATGFQPDSRFLFIGVGIVNCSLPELPQGVISHSNAIGFRLSGSSVGVIRRGAFAQVSKVRYIELTGSRVDSVEGPQIGSLRLSHRQDVHHGSRGLLFSGCQVGVVQEGALDVSTESEDEFVEISDSTIGELGPGGLSVSGVGSFLVNHTAFRYLATGALDISVRGDIWLLHSRVAAAAPVPLWRVRGGNGTQLVNITFSQRPSPGLVLLDRPSGDERLGHLRFACLKITPGWTGTAAEQATAPAGLRRYLLHAEAAAGCDPAGAVLTAASKQVGAAAGGSALFSNPKQVGLELLVLTLVATVAAAAGVVCVAAVRRRRRRRRRAETDTRVLVATDASSGESCGCTTGD